MRSSVSSKPPREPLRAFSRSLPMALLRAREVVMARFRPMLREHDLTEQQWRVLRALQASKKPLRFGQIALATCLSLPSLSRLLKTLETRGLVRRAVHADDLRAAQVTLSRDGRHLIAKIAPVSEEKYAEITEVIGAHDLDALYALLEHVTLALAPPLADVDDA